MPSLPENKITTLTPPRDSPAIETPHAYRRSSSPANALPSPTLFSHLSIEALGPNCSSPFFMRIRGSSSSLMPPLSPIFPGNPNRLLRSSMAVGHFPITNFSHRFSSLVRCLPVFVGYIYSRMEQVWVLAFFCSDYPEIFLFGLDLLLLLAFSKFYNLCE